MWRWSSTGPGNGNFHSNSIKLVSYGLGIRHQKRPADHCPKCRSAGGPSAFWWTSFSACEIQWLSSSVGALNARYQRIGYNFNSLMTLVSMPERCLLQFANNKGYCVPVTVTVLFNILTNTSHVPWFNMRLTLNKIQRS